MENSTTTGSAPVNNTQANTADAEEPVNRLFFYINEVDQDLYKQIGFYTVIKPGVNPSKIFNAKRGEILDALHRKRQKINKVFDHKLQGIKLRIAAVKDDIEACEKSYEEHITTDLEAATLKQQQLQYELAEIKEQIKELIYDLNTKRGNVVKARADELKQEIEETLEQFNTIVNKRYSKYNDDFAKNDRFLTDKVLRLKGYKEEARQRLEMIEQKLKFIPGATQWVSKIILNISLVGIFATGWFFPTISSASNETSFLEYALYYMYRFGRDIVTIEGTDTVSKLKYLGALVLGMLLFFGLVYKLSTNALKKAEQLSGFKKQHDDDKAFVNLEYKSDTDFSFIKSHIGLKISGSTILSVLLKLMPFILCLFALYIVVIFSNNGISYKNVADTSLPLIGGVITLLFSAIMYLYFTHFIENRYARMALDNGSTQSSKIGIQTYSGLRLAGMFAEYTVAFFLLFGLIVVFVFSDIFSAHPNYSFAKWIMYGALSYTVSLLFGFGMRNINIRQAYYDAYKEHGFFSHECDFYSGLSPAVFLARNEDALFRKKYEQLLEDLYDLYSIKNELLKHLIINDKNAKLNTITILKKKSPPENKPGWFQRLFKGRKSKIPSYAELHINEFSPSPAEDLYFPEHTAKIKQLEKEYAEKHIEYVRLGVLIVDIRTETSEVCRKIRYRLKDLRKTKSRLDDLLLNYRYSFSEVNASLVVEKQSVEKDLNEGYDLGIWYRENDIGPTSGFFADEAKQQRYANSEKPPKKNDDDTQGAATTEPGSPGIQTNGAATGIINDEDTQKEPQ